MEQKIQQSGRSTPPKANHLCVLVHGLWGNSQHLDYVTRSLREKYGEDELIVHPCVRNASSFTYDGIDVGGERVAREVEEKLDELERDGHKITKFSIVGYSLGGLIARYAIGLLDHNGYFDNMAPINFTTFASPHLGVRTPLVGYAGQIWNLLGSRTLSASGRQLFAVDNFRDTNRPILAVLADPDSIFVQALARFENRVLYTNIVNDRSAPYYTTSISKTDPYVDVDKLDLNYVKNYEPIVLDPVKPFQAARDAEPLSLTQRFSGSSQAVFKSIPMYLALSVLIPVGTVVFLINSGIQTVRSQRRILMHEKDESGLGFGVYKIPYMVRNMRAGIENAFEITNSAQGQEYLQNSPREPVKLSSQSRTDMDDSSSVSSETSDEEDLTNAKRSTAQPHGLPTLALTSEQFSMIDTLDDVGFRKYGVHIHNSSHSHAAIIVRTSRASLAEGKVVIRHWLDEEFRI